MLVPPTRKPQEFGFGGGDTHVVVNAQSKEAKFFGHRGNLLYKAPVLCSGQSEDWRVRRGNTPPGLYRLGEVWRDYLSVPPGIPPAHTDVRRQFGWLTFDMVDLEGNEDGSGRGGICLHGGGSANGWPGAWEPKQGLYSTLGCVRMHNADLLNKVLPRYEMGRVFVSVYQLTS